MEKRDKKNPGLEQWNRILPFSIDGQWKAMFKYLHDPIINNRCKEVLYKIYTHVLPVGTNIEKFGKPNNCCFCDEEEDEFHLFIHCQRIEGIWIWLQNLVLHHYDNLSLTAWEILIGYTTRVPSSNIQVWKLFHAETLRSIWASRCKLVFDGELSELEALKAQIVSR